MSIPAPIARPTLAPTPAPLPPPTGRPGPAGARRRARRRALAALPLLWALGAEAEPLRLGDPAPRWVAVRFEVSPAGVPGQLDRRYSEPVRAWLEPDAEAGLVRVEVPGSRVADTLFAEQQPEPDSFSDFVWRFDAQTGAVVSAGLRGTVRPELRWGFVRSRTRAELEVSMTTLAPGGFEPGRRIFGQRVFRFCREAAPPCQSVATRGLDPATGYVNAVGALRVRSRWLELEQFSPLGEAIFEELSPALARETGEARLRSGS